jgi:lipopolysaccharide transport system permease protein
MNVKSNRLYVVTELTRVWTYRTIRGRYRQSILGGLWAIIQPAASVAIFSVIFSLIIPINTGNVPYVLFSYAAMVPWSLFTSATSDMVDSMVSNFNLISKIYFPREVLPLATLFARLVDFFIACIVVVILMVYYQFPVYVEGLIYLPIIILLIMMLSLGLGLIGAALNVFYRDIRHIFILLLQLWFYATPIIYPVASVPERYQSLYFINPMAGIIAALRSVMFDRVLPGTYLIYSAVFSIVIFIFGYWLFRRLENRFADVV